MTNHSIPPLASGLTIPSEVNNANCELHDNVYSDIQYPGGLSQDILLKSILSTGHNLEIKSQDGVFDFGGADNDGSYFSPGIEHARLNEIVDLANKTNWFQAIRHYLSDQPDLMMSMVDTTRLAWLFHCYQEQASKKALVLGSRWGTLPTMLSDYYEAVFSTHDNLDILRFQAARAASDDKTNLVFIRSTPSQLPIKSNSMDLIVLSDTFVGQAGIVGQAGRKSPISAKEAQSALMKELNRILAPHGTLYIGAENRFGVHRLNIRQQYQTRIYSLRGYRRLLRNTDFSRIAGYWCWPNHNLPRMSGPFDGEGLKYLANKQKAHFYKAWMRLAISLFTLVPKWAIAQGAKLFSPSFILIASKEGHEHTNLQSEVLTRTQGLDSFVRLTLSQDAKLRTTYLLLKNQAVAKAVRVSIAEDRNATSPCLEAGNEGSESIAQQSRDRKRPALHQFRLDESEGVEGRLFKPASKHDIEAAGAWLRAYQESTEQEHWQIADLEKEISQIASKIHPIVESTQLEENVKSFVNGYLKAIREWSIPVTAEHGDFTLPNLMFSTDEKIQVIDWEHSRRQGHPFMDIGSLCLSFLRRGHNSNSATELSPEMTIGWFFDGFSKKSSFTGAPTECHDSAKTESQFHRALLSTTGSPALFAPAYYVMRVMDRIVSYQPMSSPATYLELKDTWIPLLALAIDHHSQGMVPE